MRTACFGQSRRGFISARGVTLVELIVFIVIISITLATLLGVIGAQVGNSVDPVARVQAVEKAQALLDEILARKFDQNTPTGGVPHCDFVGPPAAPACAGIAASGVRDDVGDYHTYGDGDPLYPVTVSVVEAGGDLGIAAGDARRITVTVSIPGGEDINISAYRTNF